MGVQKDVAIFEKVAFCIEGILCNLVSYACLTVTDM